MSDLGGKPLLGLVLCGYSQGPLSGGGFISQEVFISRRRNIGEACRSGLFPMSSKDQLASIPKETSNVLTRGSSGVVRHSRLPRSWSLPRSPGQPQVSKGQLLPSLRPSRARKSRGWGLGLSLT